MWRTPCLYGPEDGGVALLSDRPADGQKFTYTLREHTAVYEYQMTTGQLVMVDYRNRRLGDQTFFCEP